MMNSTTPELQTSAFAPEYARCARISGAMYERVPHSVRCRLAAIWSWSIAARPKSASFSWKSASSRMFSGLMSRCEMPSECAVASAPSSWLK